MTYFDSLAVATWMALDADTPQELLPLTVANQAAALCGCDADQLRLAHLH